MKNFKKILTLGSISSVAAIPFLIASCQKTDTEDSQKKIKELEEKLKLLEQKTKNLDASKVRELYFSTNDQYNNLLEALSKKTGEIFKKLDKEKDKNNIDKLNQELLNIYFQAKVELTPLVQEINYLFKKLKELEKDSKVKTVKIFHTNDEHGRLKYDAGKYNLYSGMERTGKYLKNINRDLLISAGDMIQGLPLSDSDKGETISKIAKYTGYDSVTVGNHEFDYGLDHIRNLNEQTSKSEFGRTMPFISANIVWKDFKDVETKPDGYSQENVGKRVFKPWIIKELDNNLKVAIIGLTTPDTRYTSHPKNSELVDFVEPVDAAKKAIEELKVAHPEINFVIISSHLGTGRNTVEWTSEYLAKNVEGVDLVIDGHSHTYVKIHDVEGTKVKVTQTEAYTKYLGDIDLTFDTETGTIVDVKQQLRDIYQITVATADNNDLWIEELEKKFNEINKVIQFTSPGHFKHVESQIIGQTPYWIGRIKPTSLGVLASNALAWEFVKQKSWEAKSNWEAATLDNLVGLTNGGGLRTDLKEGQISRGDILGISPFGNRISAVRVKGDTLLEVIKHGASKGKSGAYGQWSSNVSFTINVEKEEKDNQTNWVWKLDESSVKINDKAIDNNKYYYIVTNDFILAGGDGYKMLDISKANEKAELAYEGNEYIKTLIEYAKIYSKDSLTQEESQALYGHKLSDYLTGTLFNKQVVNIPQEANPEAKALEAN
ncbi:5'-nucleotidase C-terminal domain-containing protein [Mesomycoplasma lagogenitalium]|uniref:5'-nucleotidase C-terminal domain-containing protein n=1 Tax=Mesomycoplasma lagogenitalium TaxID=171286 RepID=A0ABY8LXI7_9BACT|nr:5'-nucleotidase C-terminal domain-containing protein [Mesomycoplasma lagogenitalium]WGI36852.1 5'-nucleotidase C-terminal domain-containing protein [Mesomycoplasma lagogenitalium]